jgi:two-component system response regulator HydG
MAKILCVDDDPRVIMLKRRILEGAGHTVVTACSVQEAKAKLESEEFEAVVTDWRLGDGNGRMVVQAAKERSTVPVVVVSGYIEDAYQAAEPQPDLYLEKPADPTELLTIINELLKAAARYETSKS